jgi:hypothetical protein
MTTPAEPTPELLFTVNELARTLRREGSALVDIEAAIRKDIREGAPVRPDGRLDPFEYAAWLASRTP